MIILGAMGFARVHVGHVHFASVLLCSRLKKNVSFTTCILISPYKVPSINPSQMPIYAYVYVCSRIITND